MLEIVPQTLRNHSRQIDPSTDTVVTEKHHYDYATTKDSVETDDGMKKRKNLIASHWKFLESAVAPANHSGLWTNNFFTGEDDIGCTSLRNLLYKWTITNKYTAKRGRVAFKKKFCDTMDNWFLGRFSGTASQYCFESTNSVSRETLQLKV